MLPPLKKTVIAFACITGVLCQVQPATAQEKNKRNAAAPMQTPAIKPAPAAVPDDADALAAQFRAAQPPAPVDEDKPSHDADILPDPGYDINKYLRENIIYPEKEFKEGVQGRVVVQFIVNKQGAIRKAKVTKSVSPAIDAEALRVVNAMPVWQRPAMLNGNPVNVIYTLPISFGIRR